MANMADMGGEFTLMMAAIIEFTLIHIAINFGAISFQTMTSKLQRAFRT